MGRKVFSEDREEQPVGAFQRHTRIASLTAWSCGRGYCLGFLHAEPACDLKVGRDGNRSEFRHGAFTRL